MINENKIETIFNELDEYCEKTNKFTGRLTFSFDFSDDEMAIFTVFDGDYMEDEDDIKEDVISVFKANGVNPSKVEWDYDCGNMYDRYCNLEITF